MADYEYWVDTVAGDNANDGSESNPYQTLRHASTSGIPNGLSDGDTVTLNIVPSGTYDDADDYIRPEPTEWTGGKLVVKSSTGEQVNIVASQVIYMIGASDLELEIQDVSAVVNTVMLWAGLTTDTGTGLRLTVRGNCVFNHARTNAENAITFDSDASGSSLTIEDGATFNGWSSVIYGTDLRFLNVSGMVHNAGDSLGDTMLVSTTGGDCSIRNSTFNWPNKVINELQLRAQDGGGNVEFVGNKLRGGSTATSLLQLFAPTSAGQATCQLLATDNDIVVDCDAAAVQIGTNISDGSSRATLDAASQQFADGIVENNDIVNVNEGGRALNVYVGADGIKIRRNYIRRGTLNNTTNVHGVYLHAAGVRFENNYCQAEVLPFGPGQILRGNVIIDKRAVLLGGTGGGSQTIGGGNDYFITDNVLIAFSSECISDYAFNGSYGSGSNLGTLRAVVDRNVYVVLPNANGVALLTDNDLTPTTLDELQNVWQESALSGSGSVWGEETNKANDGLSVILEETTHFESICVQGAALTSEQLQQLKGIALPDVFDMPFRKRERLVSKIS